MKALSGTSVRFVRPHIDVLEAVGILPEARLDFHDDTVLIQLLIHRRNLTLAKGVIERIVDRRGAHARGVTRCCGR